MRGWKVCEGRGFARRDHSLVRGFWLEEEEFRMIEAFSVFAKVNLDLADFRSALVD